MKVNSKAVINFKRPEYLAGGFGNCRCRPNKVNTIKKNPMKKQELNKYPLLPGHMVSSDHYISKAIGRPLRTKYVHIHLRYSQKDVFYIKRPWLYEHQAPSSYKCY